MVMGTRWEAVVLSCGWKVMVVTKPWMGSHGSSKPWRGGCCLGE